MRVQHNVTKRELELYTIEVSSETDKVIRMLDRYTRGKDEKYTRKNDRPGITRFEVVSTMSHKRKLLSHLVREHKLVAFDN